MLPDHLQLSGHFLSMTAIIQQAGDLLKRYSPSNIPIHLPFKIQTVKIKKQQEIGQHRGWEPCLRDGRDFQQSIDYIG